MTNETSTTNPPDRLPDLNDVPRTDTNDDLNEGFDNPVHLMPDWMHFMLFMRFLDAPHPVPLTPRAQRGRDAFASVGCVACHTPQMRTAAVIKSDALRDKPVNLYSDLLIHHMGANLADNIIQGAAGPDMFRTTPLWGVGQRIFFLHDGRTKDLIQAIEAHFSPAASADSVTRMPALGPSEANKSIEAFRRLSPNDKQAILDFLRSL